MMIVLHDEETGKDIIEIHQNDQQILLRQASNPITHQDIFLDWDALKRVTAMFQGMLEAREELKNG